MPKNNTNNDDDEDVITKSPPSSQLTLSMAVPMQRQNTLRPNEEDGDFVVGDGAAQKSDEIVDGDDDAENAQVLEPRENATTTSENKKQHETTQKKTLRHVDSTDRWSMHASEFGSS